METKIFYFNPLRECCYVLWDGSSGCAFIDPGCSSETEFQRLKGFVDEKGLRPEKIFLTHGHFDHIYALRRCLEEWQVEVCIHEADIPLANQAAEIAASLGLELRQPNCEYHTVADGDTVSFGESTLKVIATPGHTQGCVCYYDSSAGLLFSGDTLFEGSVGRTDLPGGDFATLQGSLRILAALPAETRVYPGHGHSTTIGAEKVSNPFMRF